MGWEQAVENTQNEGGVPPYRQPTMRKANPSQTTARASRNAALLTDGQKSRWILGGMVGQSNAMERLFLQMRYVAGHLRSALIEGEPGTGKRLTAETLHALGGLHMGGFAGFEAASFLSGATASAAFDQAGGGTLYLHGLDGLSHEQQGRLMHTLHAHGLRRPGLEQGGKVQDHCSNLPRAIVFSARRALRPLVLAGRFRSDLYGRLTAVHFLLPSLRERRQDIPMLLELFAGRFAENYGKRIAGVSPEALSLLMRHRWPGNVAELEVMVSRAVLRARGEWLQIHDLLPHFVEQPARAAARAQDARGGLQGWKNASMQAAVPQAPCAESIACEPAGEPAYRAAVEPEPAQDRQETAPEPPRNTACAGNPACNSDMHLHPDPNLDRMILQHVLRVLASVDGNKLQAARLLGISRSTLYRLLETQAQPAAVRAGDAAEDKTGACADREAE